MSRAMMASMIDSMKDPNAAKKIEKGMAGSKTQMEESRRQQAREQERQSEEAAEESSRQDEPERNDMMEKGMETFKGLFK